MPHLYQPDSMQDRLDEAQYNKEQDRLELDHDGRELHGLPQDGDCGCDGPYHAESCILHPRAAEIAAWSAFMATSPTWEQIRKWEYTPA